MQTIRALCKPRDNVFADTEEQIKNALIEKLAV